MQLKHLLLHQAFLNPANCWRPLLQNYFVFNYLIHFIYSSYTSALYTYKHTSISSISKTFVDKKCFYHPTQYYFMTNWWKMSDSLWCNWSSEEKVWLNLRVETKGIDEATESKEKGQAHVGREMYPKMEAGNFKRNKLKRKNC